MWVGLGAVLASIAINLGAFVLAATFLKGGWGAGTRRPGPSRVQFDPTAQRRFRQQHPPPVRVWCDKSFDPRHLPCLARCPRCAGPRAKPVISEEALEELDINRKDAPKALPSSIVKVGRAVPFCCCLHVRRACAPGSQLARPARSQLLPAQPASPAAAPPFPNPRV